jgi:hypothetical protein
MLVSAPASQDLNRKDLKVKLTLEQGAVITWKLLHPHAGA